MSKYTNPLQNLKVAAPCSANWDEMSGTESKRFCGSCKLNVYNLSGMSKLEAENLLRNSEGRVCVRFYQRADGTVLTKNCPVGLEAIKRRVSRIAAAACSMAFGILGGLGMNAAFSQKDLTESLQAFAKPTPPPERLMGEIAVPRNTPKPKSTPTPKLTPKDEPTMGKPMMGDVAVPPTPKSKRH